MGEIFAIIMCIGSANAYNNMCVRLEPRTVYSSLDDCKRNLLQDQSRQVRQEGSTLIETPSKTFFCARAPSWQRVD